MRVMDLIATIGQRFNAARIRARMNDSPLRGAVSLYNRACARLQSALFSAQIEKLNRQSWLLPAGQDLGERMAAVSTSVGDRVRLCLIGGTAAAVLLALASLAFRSSPASLVRPASGESPAVVDLLVEASYRDHKVRRPVTLRIQPKAMTKSEEAARIRSVAAGLPRAMLGENTSPDQIRSDLVLATFDSESGVHLSWESSEPSRIAEDGSVNVIGVVSGEAVSLTATLRLGETEAVHTYTVTVVSGQSGDYDRSLRRTLDGLQAALNDSSDGERLVLPEGTDRGVVLKWGRQTQATWALPILLCLLFSSFLYLSRYDRLQQEMKRRKKDIEWELPNLFLQLTLLLNAGLVVTSAFDVILTANESRSHALYELLADIRLHCLRTNESFVQAFYRFARTTGNRDLLRMAALIVDHAARGSELAEKLERERTHLWEGRMQMARGRAREVETKLCFPLMMLLGVLVVIAVSPALLEM